MSATSNPHTVRTRCTVCRTYRRRYPDRVTALLAVGGAPTTKRNRWQVVPCGPAWHVTQHPGNTNPNGART